VRVEGGHVEVRDGEASRVVYELGAAVERATATVRAADGSVVRVVELGGQAAGEHTFEFDGENAEGVAVPDGSYTVEVTAAAPGAPPEPVALTSVATVEGVDLSSDPPVVLVAGRRVPLDEILEVRAEERAASAAP
jgi:flagellar basal-body rod modification protein FlgD